MTAEVSMIQERCESGLGLYGTALDTHYKMYGIPARGPRKVIVALHGRGLSSITWGPVTATTAYEHVRALVRQGYVVISIDAAGATKWSNAACMTAVDNCVELAKTEYDVDVVGLLGYSMGGLSAINYSKQNPDKVAGIFGVAPCTDLKWAYGLAGYVPAYGGGVSPDAAAFSTEINSAYACNAGTFLAATAGYRVVDEYATWPANGPIHIVHATNDTTVPAAQSQAFVDGVDDPSVTLNILPSGGHGPWTAFEPKEVTRFFNSLTWA